MLLKYCVLDIQWIKHFQFHYFDFFFNFQLVDRVSNFDITSHMSLWMTLVK